MNLLQLFLFSAISTMAATIVTAGQQSNTPVKAAVAPHYPRVAVAARVAGDVIVRVSVRPDGSVIDAVPVEGPKILLQSALEAARKWRFESVIAASADRSSEVRFSYTLVSETSNEELETVFLLPNTVVLRQRPEKPTINFGGHNTPSSPARQTSRGGSLN